MAPKKKIASKKKAPEKPPKKKAPEKPSKMASKVVLEDTKPPAAAVMPEDDNKHYLSQFEPPPGFDIVLVPKEKVPAVQEILSSNDKKHLERKPTATAATKRSAAKKPSKDEDQDEAGRYVIPIGWKLILLPVYDKPRCERLVNKALSHDGWSGLVIQSPMGLAPIQEVSGESLEAFRLCLEYCALLSVPDVVTSFNVSVHGTWYIPREKSLFKFERTKVMPVFVRFDQLAFLVPNGGLLLININGGDGYFCLAGTAGEEDGSTIASDSDKKVASVVKKGNRYVFFDLEQNELHSVSSDSYSFSDSGAPVDNPGQTPPPKVATARARERVKMEEVSVDSSSLDVSLLASPELRKSEFGVKTPGTEAGRSVFSEDSPHIDYCNSDEESVAKDVSGVGFSQDMDFVPKQTPRKVKCSLLSSDSSAGSQEESAYQEESKGEEEEVVVAPPPRPPPRRSGRRRTKPIN